MIFRPESSFVLLSLSAISANFSTPPVPSALSSLRRYLACQCSKRGLARSLQGTALGQQLPPPSFSFAPLKADWHFVKTKDRAHSALWKEGLQTCPGRRNDQLAVHERDLAAQAASLQPCVGGHPLQGVSRASSIHTRRMGRTIFRETTCPCRRECRRQFARRPRCALLRNRRPTERRSVGRVCNCTR